MNMLGLDDTDTMTFEEQKDAFKELINVYWRNPLPAIAGVRAVFNIDSAETYPDTSISEMLRGKKPQAISHFGLEVGHAKLALFVNDKTCKTNEEVATV